MIHFLGIKNKNKNLDIDFIRCTNQNMRFYESLALDFGLN